MRDKVKTTLLYTLPFLGLFVLIPLQQTGFLARVPGDIGDGRLNAYFLEHIWQVLIGRAESFVHLPIFAPNLWIVAFSDNHWGTGFVYVVWRALGFDSITSFQLWWLISFFANFAAAVIALRCLRFSTVAATVGALVFTFALPVAAHSYGHAQLSYRFGAPLALAFYIRFLLDGDARSVLIAAFFTTWQVYCTIYIGFFTLIALLFVTLAHLRFFVVPWGRLKALLALPLGCLRDWPAASKALFWAACIVLFALFCGAFLPYLIPSEVYGSDRSIGEIKTMLPRVASYFNSMTSTIWTSNAAPFQALPMRHEHQMFIGAAGLVMAIWGALLARRHADQDAARLLWVTLVALILVTLSVAGISIWVLFAHLPLASAIRAMTRIDLVMLFFAAGLIAVLVDQALRRGWLARAALMSGCAGLAVEAYFISPPMTPVDVLEAAVTADLSAAEAPLSENAILFVSQTHNAEKVGGMPWFAMEIRAMWMGSALGAPVINGYSGKFPEGSNPQFGEDCSEAGRRLSFAYHSWPELETQLGSLEEVADRVVLFGFPEDCGLAQVKAAALSPRRSAPLPSSMAPQIALRFVSQDVETLTLEIANLGDEDLVPESFSNDDVKLSWRWTDAAGTGSAWAKRSQLRQVIPAQAGVTVTLPVRRQDWGSQGALEVSLVQEGVFWFHDHGMRVLQIPDPAE